jgi:hypothetical protein
MRWRAVTEAVISWFPTVVARVRGRVRLCGICGGQCGTGAGFPCQAFRQLLHTHNHPGYYCTTIRGLSNSGLGSNPFHQRNM